jgi:hypothetical protein
VVCGWVARWGEDLRRRRAQAEAAGTACYDGNLTLEGEEGGEVVELSFGHGDGWGLRV